MSSDTAQANRAMRVCLLTDVFPPNSGGSGWSTYYLGKALRDAGHSVMVLRPVYGMPPKVTHTRFGELRLGEVGVPHPPTWATKLGIGKAWSQREATRLLTGSAYSLARDGKADVLHGQHAVSGVAASRAARWARKDGTNVVSLVTVRDYWPLCPTSTRLFEMPGGETSECADCHRLAAYIRCSRAAGRTSPLAMALSLARWVATWRGSRELAKCDAVIAVSRYVQGELARSGRVPADRLHTIPNLVDLASVKLASRTEWPLSDISAQDSFLLFAGKLDRNKGAGLLPQALARSGVKLPLVVAGGGPLQESIAAEAAALGVDLRFYDWLDNNAVQSLMGAARVLLFPTAWQEPLSRVLLEGCAAGAAIVALNSGGTSDVITHRESGWLADNIAGFEEGIRQVAGDDALNSRLRQGARFVAERKFAAPFVAAEVIDLYRTLLERGGAREGR